MSEICVLSLKSTNEICAMHCRAHVCERDSIVRYTLGSNDPLRDNTIAAQEYSKSWLRRIRIYGRHG